MSDLSDSCGFMFFRRLFYAIPLLIIGGIVMLFIDPEYGGAMLGAAGVGAIIFLLVWLSNRSKKKKAAQTGMQDFQTQPQPVSDYQSYAQHEQPQQETSFIPPTATIETTSKGGKLCESCGQDLKEHENFCQNCGSPV